MLSDRVLKILDSEQAVFWKNKSMGVRHKATPEFSEVAFEVVRQLMLDIANLQRLIPERNLNLCVDDILSRMHAYESHEDGACPPGRKATGVILNYIDRLIKERDEWKKRHGDVSIDRDYVVKHREEVEAELNDRVKVLEARLERQAINIRAYQKGEAENVADAGHWRAFCKQVKSG